MSSYIISIDQGTTSTRSCLFNSEGQLVQQNQKEFRQIFPKPGWVEHDPEDIWQTTVETLKAVTLQIKPEEIASIGITNQRETVVVWDSRDGKPVGPAIVWQCRRTQEACDRLRQQKLAPWIHKKTGLIVDPYFSATKVQWILKNIPGAKQKARSGFLRLGTIDSFLLWRLSGGKSHATDVTNASRTMLMNLGKCEWDKDLLKLFDVPLSMLPQIRSSNDLFGETRGLRFLPDGIPIFGMIGDQQAALFGQAAFAPGDAKCTFGTGSFILLNMGPKIILSKNRLLTTVAWRLDKQKTVYALEGGAFVCGAAVQWLRDGMGLIEKSSDVETLARQVSSSEGVEFVPALTGLGAPHWNAEARGLITGLTRGTTKAHLAYATLEAMALQNVEILLKMESEIKKKLKQLRVDGGAARNNLLMQMQANYLGCPVLRPQVFETTALGAAFMAGLGVGLFSSLNDLQKKWKLDHSFKADIATTERKKRLQQWQKAIARVNL